MNSIKIIAIGKLKETWWRNAQEYYQNLISQKVSLEITELPDLQAAENLSEKEEEYVKIEEGKKILEQISTLDYVIAMDLQGEMWKKENWEHQTGVDHKDPKNGRKVVFVIGGSLGLSDEVLKRANKRICYSKMTFPHQLFRIILLQEVKEI